MTSILTKLLWTIWTVVSLLLLATLASNLEITNGFVNRGLVFIFILGLIGVVTIRKPWTPMKKLTVATTVFILFLAFKFLTDWRGDWKTQIIMYQHKSLSNRTIESQLQDKGALGYNKRTVDRTKLFPFVSCTKELAVENVNSIDTMTWEKKDIYLNEQGLKGG